MTETDPIALAALNQEVVQAEASVGSEQKLTQAELRKLYNKNYYEKRKEAGKLYKSQTKDYKKEYMKQYMQTEQGKQAQKNSYDRFLESHPGIKRELYLKYRERQLEQQKVYYQLNREAINEKARLRRLAKKQVADAAGSDVTPSGLALSQLLSALSVREE
jgi:hypothetical protein